VMHFIITVIYSYVRNIPRLSKAGMPSRSEAGAVCSKTKVPINTINKERYASLYKGRATRGL
jgi:hypothetical protein